METSAFEEGEGEWLSACRSVGQDQVITKILAIFPQNKMNI